MDPTLWIVDVSDPVCRGLLSSVLSETSQLQPDLIRRDGRLRGLRFVERNQATTGPLYNDVSFDEASVIEFAIGTPDAAPTSGAFSLSYNGNSTGLTNLAYNITATNLQTALNANPAIASAGGVTVTAASLGGQYLVAFNSAGARFTIAITNLTLQPPSNVGVAVVIEGDGSTNEVQLIALRQGYLAYNDVWVVDSSGALTVQQIQAGSGTQPEIQRVTISDSVKSGVWSLQISQAQVCRLAVSENIATKINYTLSFASVNIPTSGLYIDIWDADGPVRAWFNLAAGGGAPPAPVGGRLVEVAIADDAPATVTAAFYAEFNGDAAYVNVGAGNGTVTFTAADYGVAGENFMYDTGISVVSFSAGNWGRLDQTGFIVSDANGTVGFWLNASLTSSPPTGLAGVERLVMITTVEPGESASSAATKIAAAVHADPSFSASASSEIVTITQAAAGTRAAPVQISALLGISQSTPGYTLTGSFGINAASGDVQAVFGEIYNVTKTDDYTWEFVGRENGAQALAVGNDSGLRFAEIFTGSVELNNWNMLLAFNATQDDSIESTLEIQVTEPGQSPVKVLNIPVTIRRDVIDVASVVSPTPTSEVGNVFFLGSVTGYTGGGSTNLDGVATTTLGVPRLVQFVHATDGLRSYLLQAGTTAESSPNYIRPDDYSGSNEKVYQSVL